MWRRVGPPPFAISPTNRYNRRMAYSSTTSNKNEHVFRDMSVPRALLTFAVPSIISQLVLLAYNLADTYFLGRVGNPYMVAAVSLLLPVYNVCCALANLFGTGGGTLIARLLGAGKPDEAKRVSSFSVVAATVAAAAFALCIFASGDVLLRFLGASDATLGFAKSYAFWVLVVGGIPAVLSITMLNLARNAGLAREASIGASGSGLLNIALDPLFMFVLLPRGNEVAGAAIATALSNTCSVIYFIILFRVSRNKSVLCIIPREGLPSRSSVAAVISVGIPAALTNFLYDLTNIVIDKLSSTHGDIALAAIGIVLKAERLPLNICLGICFGMGPLVAYNFAAGNFTRMKAVFRTAQFWGAVLCAVCIAVYEAAAGAIMRLFIDNAATVALGTSYLRVRCLAPVMMFACFSFVMFFQSIGRGGPALAFAVTRQLVFNIPLLFLLDHFFAMSGIVWTQFIADAITAAISYAVYRHIARNTWESSLAPAGSGT